MTKQEILDAIKGFSKNFPNEAIREIQANREQFIPDLLESLDYAYHNAEKLLDDGSDYFLHTYAMYLLAEFREKRAFPLLVNLLRLPDDEIDFILGDSLTGCLPRLLLCTFENENIQILLDIIENQELNEWARSSTIKAYELFIKEGLISKEEGVSYLRNLIYDKLSPDDSEIVFTAIVGCVIDAKLFDMIPDARFLHEDGKVDESMHGGYDGFIDWLFHEKDDSKPLYIDNAISEIEWWACFESNRNDKPKKNNNLDDMLDKFEKNFKQENSKKVGRNDQCPCGSGKKYKKCCISEQQNSTAITRVEDIYDLLDMYPKDSALFEQMYEKEAVDIDMLVYKALCHRTIPLWVKRDYEQERIGKIDYLNEALDLFLDKCQRENITSFSAYDEQFMIHYRSGEWISTIAQLVEKGDSEKLKAIKRKAEDTLRKLR